MANPTAFAFFVPGLPKAQPRARSARDGHFYTPPKSIKGWKRTIVLTAKKHRPRVPIGSPVSVSLMFIFPRPKRLAKSVPAQRIPHTQKPDIDNLQKAVLDALTADGWFVDDALVYGGRTDKFFGFLAPSTEPPGVHVTILVDQGGVDA